MLACVRFAREHGLAFSMRGGGHNIAGLALAEGGLLIDLSLMRGVWVDPAARIARAQGGCLLGDVDRETQLHGLAAVLGFVSATGVAGLTLGGGFGYLSRRFGWTSDNVRSMELVTADGKLVRASEKENADLFWGLRGGGGNFGVVTGIDYELHPLGPEIYGGPVAWRAESAPEVLEAFRRLAQRRAARAHARDADAQGAAGALDRQDGARAARSCCVLACYSGKPEDGEKLLAPLKALGKPVGDVLQRRPYVTLQSLLDATQPKGRRYYWKSEYLPGIEPDLLAKLREHGGRITSPHSAAIVFQLGGAIASRPADHSAVGNRDAGAVFNIAASWEKPEDDAAERRVGALELARHEALLDRRHVRQLPDRGGGGRADRRRLRQEPRAPRRDQGALGPGQPVPDEQEHRALGPRLRRARSRPGTRTVTSVYMVSTSSLRRPEMRLRGLLLSAGLIALVACGGGDTARDAYTHPDSDAQGGHQGPDRSKPDHRGAFGQLGLPVEHRREPSGERLGRGRLHGHVHADHDYGRLDRTVHLRPIKTHSWA